MKTYDELHDELLLMDDASLAAVSNIYSVRMDLPQKMIYCMANLDDVMRKLGIAVPVKQLSSGSFSLSDESSPSTETSALCPSTGRGASGITSTTPASRRISWKILLPTAAISPRSSLITENTVEIILRRSHFFMAVGPFISGARGFLPHQ